MGELNGAKRATWWRRWYWNHVHRIPDDVRWACGLGWFETIEVPEWRAKRRTLCVTIWGTTLVLYLWPITARKLERLKDQAKAEGWLRVAGQSWDYRTSAPLETPALRKGMVAGEGPAPLKAPRRRW